MKREMQNQRIVVKVGTSTLTRENGSLNPVSYTHLDVYKRQAGAPSSGRTADLLLWPGTDDCAAGQRRAGGGDRVPDRQQYCLLLIKKAAHPQKRVGGLLMQIILKD